MSGQFGNFMTKDLAEYIIVHTPNLKIEDVRHVF